MLSIRKVAAIALAVVFVSCAIVVADSSQAYAYPAHSERTNSTGVDIFETHNSSFVSTLDGDIIDSEILALMCQNADTYRVSDYWVCDDLMSLAGGEKPDYIKANYFRSISLVVGSYVRGSISINTVAIAGNVADRVGLRTLSLQRYLNGRWTTVRGWSNDYDYDTFRFNAARTYDGLVSNAIYRVVATFTLRDGSTTATMTRTTGSLRCR